jgi:hypothetical protein
VDARRARASRNSSNGVRPLTRVSWNAASALPDVDQNVVVVTCGLSLEKRFRIP